MYVKPCIKDIVRIGGDQGRAGYLRLDMNENPGGLPLAFVEAVKKELTPEYLAMYPEEGQLQELLADYLKQEYGCMVTSDNLCLTNGSDMAIRYLYEVFAEPESRVVTVAPSFEMYRIYSLVFGLNHYPVMYHDDFTLPVEEVLAAITQDTDIVVLLNPNNPVGRAFTETEFISIVAKADQVGALVVVDEAYHYFYCNTFLLQALKLPNVVVIRTFSKLMSLAGCRLGYMVAGAEIIEYIRHVRPSFEVNTIAIKFAEHLLKQPKLLEELQQVALEGKQYLIKDLEQHEYQVMIQDGNFIFVCPKHVTAREISQRLEAKKILVKTYGASLLKDWLRISTGSREHMERFLQAFYEVDCE